MNVLILSANTGGGHNATARALTEELSARGIACTTENTLAFGPKVEEDIVVDGHTFAYKYLPEVFEAGYKYAENHSAYPIYLNYSKYAPAVKRYIERFGYDTVICCHVFASHILTRIRRRYALPIKQYFIATDYTCSPGYELADMDRVFIPAGLSREFTLAGMDADMLLETGIPVRMACYEPLATAYAREQVFSEAPITPNEKLVLVAPGVLDAEQLGYFVRAVRRDVPDAVFVTICGKANTTLRRQINQLDLERVFALPYTTRMDLWMKAADVLVTKPGGLTSTEAVSCGVPTILMDVAPGLETHNRDYHVNHGCASAAAGVPALYVETVRLLLDEEAAARMRANQRARFAGVSVRELVDEVVRQDAEWNERDVSGTAGEDGR
mgnify:CR=1 FL=1